METIPLVRPSLAVRGLGVQTRGGAALLAPTSFDVPSGALVAVMGPSGAGKSTLVEAIAGVSPHRVDGVVAVAGAPTSARRRRADVAFSRTTPHLVGEVSLRANLVFDVVARSVPEATLRARCDELRLDVDDPRPLATYSTGETKRAQLVLDLLREPSLLVLDEPTTGLSDADAIELVRTLASLRVTILLVIHQPRAEVRALFDAVLLVSRGRVVAYGDVDAAAARVDPTSDAPALHVVLDALVEAPSQTEALLSMPVVPPLVDAPPAPCVGSPPWHRQVRGLAAQHGAFWWALRRNAWLVFAAQCVVGIGLIQFSNSGVDEFSFLFKTCLVCLAMVNAVSMFGSSQQHAGLHPVRLADNRAGRTAASAVALVEIAVPLLGHAALLPGLCAWYLLVFGLEWTLYPEILLCVLLYAAIGTSTQFALKWILTAHAFAPAASMTTMLLGSSTGLFTTVDDVWPAALPLLYANPLFYALQYVLRVSADDFDADLEQWQCFVGVAAYVVAAALVGWAAQRWRR